MTLKVLICKWLWLFEALLDLWKTLKCFICERSTWSVNNTEVLLELWMTLKFSICEWDRHTTPVNDTDLLHLWMMPEFCISEWLWHLTFVNTEWHWCSTILARHYKHWLSPCTLPSFHDFQVMNKLCFLTADCLPDRCFYGAEQQRRFIFLFFVLCFESQNNKVFGITKQKKRERERERSLMNNLSDILSFLCETFCHGYNKTLNQINQN